MLDNQVNWTWRLSALATRNGAGHVTSVVFREAVWVSASVDLCDFVKEVTMNNNESWKSFSIISRQPCALCNSQWELFMTHDIIQIRR